MSIEGEDWPLASGVWKRTTGPHGWVPMQRSDGRAFPDRVAATERLHLVQTSAGAQGEKAVCALFPIDFSYSPDTGEPLTKRPRSASRPWVPPYGEAVRQANEHQLSDNRGLRQTSHTIVISPSRKQGSGGKRTPQDDADRSMVSPLSGHYEFAVGRFGADVDTLLAIEPEKAILFVWLAGGGRWAPLNSSGSVTLGPCLLDREQWRAELEIGSGDAGETKLFLPTASGLAVLSADAITLSYSVEYLGDGQSCWGAPVSWKGEIWVPLRTATGLISLLSVRPDGKSSMLHGTTIQAPAKALCAPVCNARQVVWPSAQGQLVLDKKLDGTSQTNWLPWGSGLAPRFSFGSPYLSSTGNFWQLCWRDSDGFYVYVRMGKIEPETMTTNAPAFCTGQRTFKMMSAMQGDPWHDPQDSRQENLSIALIPILESALRGTVLGLVVDAADGMMTLLESQERQTAVLQLRTHASADLRFLTVQVPAPWRTRAFVFDGCLWVYHPELLSIRGTELEPE